MKIFKAQNIIKNQWLYYIKIQSDNFDNESAAYFNKSLYPYFNEFERKLRKLLYLKSALQHDATASQNIKELESKDLGTIFELLFTDTQFIKDVKKASMKNHGNLQEMRL